MRQRRRYWPLRKGIQMQTSAIAFFAVIGWSCSTSAQAVDRLNKPTMSQQLDQSLEQLLNEGYTIVAVSGLQFTLRKGGKWIWCSADAGGIMGHMPWRSQCIALN